jgi:hypothetical protein
MKHDYNFIFYIDSKQEDMKEEVRYVCCTWLCIKKKKTYYIVKKEGIYPTKNTMEFILISLAMSHDVKASLQPLKLNATKSSD